MIDGCTIFFGKFSDKYRSCPIFNCEIWLFRAKSDNYGTCLEIGQLRIGQLRYNPCNIYLANSICIQKTTIIFPMWKNCTLITSR